MTAIGYVAAVMMGGTLGMIGGGGSILTVPILVYLFKIPPVLATAYSLFVVGLTGLVGSISYMKQGLVNFRAAIAFGIPSFVGVFLSRRFVIPALPDAIFTVGTLTVTRDALIMLVFAIVMILAAVSMLRNGVKSDHEGELRFNVPLTALEGLVVGVVTGFVGAGGGFLIIPALVVLVRLPMKLAIGTSLLIIAFKSLLGFTGDLNASQEIDWLFLAQFSALSIAGILIGTFLNRRVSAARLKPAFGWFVLAMGLFVLGRELLF